VRQLELTGIAISAGSACHGKSTPSPVLLAMGYHESKVIRLSLGRDTTTADVDWVAMVLKQVLQRLTPYN